MRATRECMHWRTAMTTVGGGQRLSETSCPPRFNGATCACCGIETGGGDRTTTGATIKFLPWLEGASPAANTALLRRSLRVEHLQQYLVGSVL